MRPLDIFSEKSIRDGSPDKIASTSALVYEAHSLALQVQLHKTDAKHDPKNPHSLKPGESDFNSAVGFGKRDQMALASLAFCSPLMMLGMGAALGISDTIRMNKEQALKEAPLRRIRQGALERAEASKERSERTEQTLPSESTITKLNFRVDSPRKSKLEFKNRQENVLYPSAWRQPDSDKTWVKASKLVKRKQQMMDQLAKCRGLLQLNVVSAILSKIELLDKELKKMGC